MNGPSDGTPPPPKGMFGRTLQAVSGLGSAAASLTPTWAKNGLKHLVCNIADVVAPPLPPEGPRATVEEQISEQLSSISTMLQEQQLDDGSDQATHAKLAIQYQLTRISQVLDERKRRAGSVPDDAAVAASITSSSSSSSSSISSSSDTDGTVILPHSGHPGPPPTPDTLRLLFSRTRHGRHKEVAAILSQGIPVDIRDEFGNTPLLIAAQNGHIKIVKMLLRSRAHINAQNNKGMSAMHFAFTFGYPELGAYLVSKGGDDAIKNSDNRTCYECSSSSSLQSLSAPADSLRVPSTPAAIDPWSSASTDPFSPLSLPSPSPSTPGPFSELASSWDSSRSMSASDGALYLARAAQLHVAAHDSLLPPRTGRALSAAAASASALPSTPPVSYFVKQESSIALPPSPGSPYQQPGPGDALSSRDTERSGAGVAVGRLSRGDSLGV